MPNQTPNPKALLGRLLRDVSRSFYLTLRILPGAVRQQIGLAYLLARATDTIADTDVVPVTARLDALNQLRCRILGQTEVQLDFGAFTKPETTSADESTASPAERKLLRRVEEALTLLARFDSDDRQRIRDVLETIMVGQQLDLERFETSKQSITALPTDKELDDYTYRVAGCVGEFWTRMCRAHLFPRTRLNEAKLIANGIRFGKGLQLVNILRDLPADLRKGRCYLPQKDLNAIGLEPQDLLELRNESRLRPLYDRWLDQTQSHLEAGWEYTLTLPWRCARVRLACAWPLLIGAQTLKQLRSQSVLNPNERVKVSRPEVYNIIRRTVLFYPFPSAWRRLFNLDSF